MSLLSIHSCFQWYKNYKNRPRNTRVIVENKAAPSFRTRCTVVDIVWGIYSDLWLHISVCSFLTCDNDFVSVSVALIMHISICCFKF